VSTAEATVNYFKEEIEEELLTTGDKLPSEQALQHQLGISRFSLREGLA
jgi:DNA-binding FadR family transcriptional regulator